MSCGFNLPDDFSQRAFDRYWAGRLDFCQDCQSEPCRCDGLNLEDDYIDKECDTPEFKEEFRNG